MSYADHWSRFWCVPMAIGVGIGALLWSPLPVTGGVAFGWVAAVMGLLVLGKLPERWATDPAARRSFAMRSLALGATGVAALAVATVSPPVALLVGLLAFFSSPLLVRRLWRHSPRDAGSRPGTSRIVASPSADPPCAVGELTDSQLCRMWRRTYWELQSRKPVEELLRSVVLRQSCLDELERRNPTALLAWLASGARASGGPEKFLTERQPRDGT